MGIPSLFPRGVRISHETTLIASKKTCPMMVKTWHLLKLVAINNNNKINDNNNNNMLKQDDHFSYKNCYQYGSFINVNEYIDKNLIIYETGIHYINMIKKKGSLIMNKTAYNH